ncbi:hypothetical protein [Paenibacillus ihuae]|uniref:hypothetical protein n=1 Tax=Paenibacillus ihuae TaxID=1232431 RepID=UPI000B2DE7DE|nr:hypothetical protein [Paenibacillus ihuae]
MLEKRGNEIVEVENIQQVVSSNPEQAGKEKWPVLENLLKHIQANARLSKVTSSFRQSTIFTDRLGDLIEEMINSRLDRRGNNSDTDTPESTIQRELPSGTALRR